MSSRWRGSAGRGRGRGTKRSNSAIDSLHLIASRLYFSHLYSALYLIMIILNIVVIAWMLRMPGGYDGSMSFLVLQVTVNLALVVEVVIRLMAQQEKFFSQWDNIFDTIVMALVIVSQLLYIHPPDVAAAAKEWEDIGATVLRILRDGVLFARLYIFLKNRRKNQVDSGDVDFESISDNDHLPLLFAGDLAGDADFHLPP